MEDEDGKVETEDGKVETEDGKVESEDGKVESEEDWKGIDVDDDDVADEDDVDELVVVFIPLGALGALVAADGTDGGCDDDVDDDEVSGAIVGDATKVSEFITCFVVVFSTVVEEGDFVLTITLYNEKRLKYDKW